MITTSERKEKVYCERCKWLCMPNKWPSYKYVAIELICMHPKNVTFHDTYLKPVKQYVSKPEQLNKYNDCLWYEPK
jgi:hypothetical protein